MKENARFMVVVAPPDDSLEPHPIIVAWSGGELARDIAHNSHYWADCSIHDHSSTPLAPGISVWEGELEFTGCGDYHCDCDVYSTGAFRPATAREVVRFKSGRRVWEELDTGG